MQKITLFALRLALFVCAGCSAIVDTDGYRSPPPGGTITANAGADQVVAPAATVTLDASSSSTTLSRALSFVWQQTGGPTVDLVANGATASFTAPAQKAHLTFVVLVDDGRSSQAMDEVAIDVNSQPVAVAGLDREVMSARRIYLNAGPSRDPDVEPLTYQWTQLSGPTTTLDDATTPVASLVSPEVASSLVFRVTVCDAVQSCSTDDVSIDVHRWVDIAAGWFHVVALRSDGTVWTWGEDQFGDLGLGDTNGANHSSVPLQVVGLPPVVKVFAGNRASYAITATGETYAWGINCSGESGYARVAVSGCDTVDVPKLVDAGFRNFDNVARTDESALYLAPNGAMSAIGYNKGGMLGVCPPPIYYTSPITIAGTWSAMSINDQSDGFGLGIDSGGHLLTWGTNSAGQLGTNTTSTTCVTPTQVGSGAAWTDVAAGTNIAAGILDGRLYTWGANGNGAGMNQLTPAFRGFLTGYVDVESRGNFALALRSDGTLYAWGSNGSGELGLGDTTPRYLAGNVNDPPQVGSESTWGDIAAGIFASFGLKNDGSVHAWGSSGHWLGQGATPQGDLLSPTRVVDGPVSCGDAVVTQGTVGRLPFPFTEACDDGALNGNPGRCSAACRCPSTRVVYVDGSATGANDGSSWANAFTRVQSAIDLAGACDTIWVAEGTYSTDGAAPDVPVAAMTPTTELYGGFAGFETHFAQRNPALNPTILDGQGTTYHVVVGANGGMIDGFTVRGGRANGPAPDDAGGGLFITAAGTAPFIIRGMRFESNVAVSRGGAIEVSHASDRRGLLIDDCTFVSNTARSGGGISISGPQSLIRNSRFYSNAATSLTATGGLGGAIWHDSVGGLPTIVDNLFVANSSSNAGNAMWIGRQAWIAVLTAFGNTGSNETLHFDAASTLLTHAASWNPGVTTAVNQGIVTYSCAETLPPGTGNVSLTASPFEVVGTGDTTAPFLSTTSPCRDAGSVTAVVDWFDEWSLGSTTADGSLDVGAPDIGYHWLWR